MKKSKLLLLAFLLVIFLVPALTAAECLLAPSGWSVYENRALASVPEHSLSAVLSGKTADGIESFLKDHLVRRNLWLKAYTALELDVLHSPVVNEVAVTDRALLPEMGVSDYDDSALEEQAAAMAGSLAKIRLATEENGGVFLYVGVPEQRSALRSLYPGWMNSNAAEWDAREAAFSKAMAQACVPLLLMRPVFDGTGDVLTYYSAVDHHYNLRGAYLTYETVCRTLTDMGVPLTAEKMTVTGLDNPYFGTYSRKLYGLSPIREQLLVGSFADEIPYERWDNGERTDAPMTELPETSAEPVYYTAYMEGDQGETIVKTGREGLPKLLIVGDSFTNALETMIWRNFGEMRSLDYRHYTGESLSDYIKDYQPDVVLVMRDDTSYLSTAGNGGLK